MSISSDDDGDWPVVFDGDDVVSCETTVRDDSSRLGIIGGCLVSVSSFHDDPVWVGCCRT